MTTLMGLLVACVPRLGHPHVTYAHDAVLPIVHPSNDEDRWYVVFHGEFGDELWFLDTGYSYTTCDDGMVAARGVETRGKVRIRGEAGDVFASRARIPEFRLGTHQVRMNCVVRDLDTTSSIADPPEVPVMGVLGSDVLTKFDVEIDPSVPSVTLLPRNALKFRRSDPGVVQLKREYAWGLRFRVPVGLADDVMWPVVDTGATGTHVDGERLGLEPTLRQNGVSVRASGATGVIVRDLVYYRVEQLDLAEGSVGPLMLTDRARGPWAAGLLGLNVLAEFRQEYDFDRGLARFVAVPQSQVPSWAEWASFGAPTTP